MSRRPTRGMLVVNLAPRRGVRAALQRPPYSSWPLGVIGGASLLLLIAGILGQEAYGVRLASRASHTDIAWSPFFWRVFPLLIAFAYATELTWREWSVLPARIKLPAGFEYPDAYKAGVISAHLSWRPRRTLMVLVWLLYGVLWVQFHS